MLTPLVGRGDRTIHLDWISEQWDRMGQFYASLESGHTTASVALKRLAGFNGKNHFYRANRELGRIFKTEFILQYLSQPPLRRRIRQGLLKGEQLHSLARDVFHGKRGRISAREMERVITKPDSAVVDLLPLEHISPSNGKTCSSTASTLSTAGSSARPSVLNRSILPTTLFTAASLFNRLTELTAEFETLHSIGMRRLSQSRTRSLRPLHQAARRRPRGVQSPGR